MSLPNQMVQPGPGASPFTIPGSSPARTYSCPLWSTISVPGDDVRVLVQNGWNLIGAASPQIYAEIIIPNSAASTVTMTNQNAWYQIKNGWSNDISPAGMLVNTTTGQIICGQAGIYNTTAILSYQDSSGSTDTLQFGIFKNGVSIPSHSAIDWVDGTTYPTSITLDGLDLLQVGDVLDVRVMCTTNPGVTLAILNVNFNVSFL
jgi:hypothetical protein